MSEMAFGDKFIIGLTGNIACGKSTVLKTLAELGATTIDADTVTRELQRKGAAAYAPIVAEFGAGILQPDGELDRRALGNIVFADPAALRRLETIVHPLVREEVARRIGAADTPVVVIDAIKLLESPLVSYCREIWVVTCAPEQQVARLIEHRGLSEAEARLRVNAQPPQAEKVARADRVIDNSGTLGATRQQVEAAWVALNPAAMAWEQGYREGRDGWDLGQPAPPLVEFLASRKAPAPGRLIVPGAGRGHDALLFAEHGFDVLGIDFAPTPVAAARAAAKQRGLSARAHFEQRDAFSLPAAYTGAFDYALEHTFLSAIDPQRRGEYARLMYNLLKPGGLLIALFFDHGRPGGPPFGIDAAGVRELFAGLLAIEKLERPKHSHPRRNGQELFGLFRKEG